MLIVRVCRLTDALHTTRAFRNHTTSLEIVLPPMKTHIVPILVALFVFGCADGESDTSETTPTERTAEARCIAPDDELTDSGIGDLQIGMPADDLVERCNVAADTTVMDVEGHPQRVALVAAGADTVSAEIVDGAVWRITVETPTWRTADSLGVGSPISVLLELPEAQGVTGEGNLVIVSPQLCGISFQVDAGDVQPPPGGAWDDEALTRIPDSAAVELIRITGCPDSMP